MMRITSAAAFGKAIRARRKELHYTQGFLSEFSGLSVSFISDLENGKKTAELCILRRRTDTGAFAGGHSAALADIDFFA